MRELPKRLYDRYYRSNVKLASQGIKTGRKIGGKQFHAVHSDTKEKCERVAKRWRKAGYLARIQMSEGAPTVFIRKQ